MRDQTDGSSKLQGLEQLLDALEAASESSAGRSAPVSLDDVLDRLGPRSYAPLLLLAGLVMIAPVVGDIPGVPTLFGVLVVIVSVQSLLRRDHVWLPRWLLERSVSPGKVRTGIGWLRRPARFVDRWTRPRQKWLVRGAGASVTVVACIGVAAATPMLEFIPFSANLAGAAITAFGLALLAEDGLVALAALVLCAATVVVVVYPFVA